MMDRTTKIAGLALAGWLVAHSSYSAVQVGDQAPMYRAVDENMQLIDMADFTDGTPLVLLYGSAT